MFFIPLDVVNGFIQHCYFCKSRKRYDIWVKTINGKDVVWFSNDFKEFDLTPYEQ